MNITILTYVESEGSKDFDVVNEQVLQALRERGHDVTILGIHADLNKLTSTLERRPPDLVFNLAEMFDDLVTGDVGIAGLLELLGIPFTGSGPGELYLVQDKALGKKILAFEGIQYPRFAVFSRTAEFETGGNLKLPLFVKPLRMDASIGIDRKALVYDTASLMDRVSEIHRKIKDAALAEEYIDGREFYVGVLGNQQAKALPVVEVDFSGLPEGAPRVLDTKAKWEVNSAEYKGTKSVLADIPDELRAKMHKVALDAYRALRVRDYGRIDLRVTETGEIYVLEVNASCYLEKSSEFAMAAEADGIPYTDLIQTIVDLAVERHASARRASPSRR
jgi:D-alanine-D-alanine ligase